MLNKDNELYVILDRVSGVFSAPFMQYNEATAVRYFNYICGNAEMVGKDSVLYKVGTYDEMQGVITPITPAQFVMAYESEVKTNGKKKKK